MTTLNTRQTFALVALFVVTSLAFIQLDNRRALDPVKDGLYAVVSPIVDAFDRVGDGPTGPSALERELAAVKAERDQLAAENVRLAGEVKEVDQLRLQAQLKKDHPSWQVLSARVRSPDPSNLQKFFIVDKGSADGVEPGMAVVAQGPNYVGQVTEVEERSAKVTLIVDATQTVGARLASGPDGIVFGMWQNGGRLEMRYLERDAKPEPGELVVTSDNGATRTTGVPGDLIVGQVERVEQDRQQDMQIVPILPRVDFDALQVVTIIKTDAP